MTYDILLVEDDEQLQEIITDYFSDKSDGSMRITCAGTGSESDEKFFDQSFDLVLLDIMLPDTDGFTLCKGLRKQSDIPIIFLTARHSEDDRLHGYALGCDDYISKPFSLAELYAKSLALIKRDKRIVREEKISAGDIVMDLYRGIVSVRTAEINLSPKTYALLKILLINHGKLISREHLLAQVWGYDFAGSDRVVDNHIKKLRQALGPAGKQIKTVVKSGYRMEG